MQWSPDDKQLASGGNDNALLLWQVRSFSTAAQLAARKRQTPLFRSYAVLSKQNLRCPHGGCSCTAELPHLATSRSH